MDEATYIAVCEAHMASLFRVACSMPDPDVRNIALA